MNSTIYSAAPGGWIWNAVTWTDASGSKACHLDRRFRLAKSALSQWQPRPTFKEHKTGV